MDNTTAFNVEISTNFKFSILGFDFFIEEQAIISISNLSFRECKLMMTVTDINGVDHDKLRRQP